MGLAILTFLPTHGDHSGTHEIPTIDTPTKTTVSSKHVRWANVAIMLASLDWVIFVCVYYVKFYVNQMKHAFSFNGLRNACLLITIILKGVIIKKKHMENVNLHWNIVRV